MSHPREKIQNMTVQLNARNATAQDLVTILNDQKARKLDLVVPARNVWSRDGQVVVKGAEAHIDNDGVTPVNGTYRPTEVFDEGLAAKLGIPQQYMRTMRNTRPDILDANVNGWLHGRKRNTQGPYGGQETKVIYPADERAFLLRLFRGDDGGEGVARAMLSDRYGLSMDNLDILTAVMSGIRESGHQPLVRVSDLSERRMRVRFEFPEINALAPNLLDGYRSPFDNGGKIHRAGTFDELRQQYGAHHIFSEKDAPLMSIGFDLSNSETGGGAYWLTPVAEVIRCTNGLVIRKEGMRKVHLGSKLAEGQVKPSLATLRKAGELVASETTDAVTQWLDKGYLEGLIAGLEEKAGVAIDSPTETVPAVTASLGFTPDEQKGILDLFVVSGQPTAGGLAQAVSAYAQTVEDPDRAYDVELRAVEAMEAAARR
jgi:hypothetical protein